MQNPTLFDAILCVYSALLEIFDVLKNEKKKYGKRWKKILTTKKASKKEKQVASIGG